MADVHFIAVENGQGAFGQLVVPSTGFTSYAVSGPWKKGDLPAGTYRITKEQDTNEKSMTYKGHKSAKKYRLAAVGPDGKYSETFYDARRKSNRSQILLHPDFGTWGTLGCIGFRGTPGSTGNAGASDIAAVEATENQLSTLVGNGPTTVQVEYFKTVEEAEARMRELGIQNPDPKAFEGPKPPAPPPKKKSSGKKKKGTSRPSIVKKKSAKIATGEPTVLLGERKLMAAHVDSVHTAGGRIVQGSPTVFVGPKLRAFARIEDPTSDSDLVGTGEPTVAIG